MRQPKVNLPLYFNRLTELKINRYEGGGCFGNKKKIVYLINKCL